MYKIIGWTLIATWLVSCNSDLESLKKERKELTGKIASANEELQKINEKIAALEKKSEHENVLTYTVTSQPFQHGIILQSNVTTDQDVMLYPEYAGTITWHIREGQAVAKGQIIASIQDGGMSAQLQQVKIQTDLAKSAYEKQARLWKENIGSEIQYLQAKTAYEAAQKSISAIQSQLSRTKLKAPFSGTIDNLIVQTGQAVAPGVPLAKLVSIGNLKVNADISEQYIAKVKIGSPVEISLPALQKKINGKVARISNAINPSNRTFSIEIPLNNLDGMIKPNMSVQLNLIDYKNLSALSIPNKAIGTNAKGEKYVYTLTKINKNSATAKKQIIQIGSANSEYTEVINGLQAGDKIIVEGNKTVVDNTVVKFEI